MLIVLDDLGGAVGVVAVDRLFRRYRIKSKSEVHERAVAESDLILSEN